jgi:hypothetical protein
MRLSEIAPDIKEAFKAGNRARKKESVQDTAGAVEIDKKRAVYAWCMNTKEAIKKLNASMRLPFRIDDFYLPEAVWNDLESDGQFESEEDIWLTGRRQNKGRKGSVSIDVSRSLDDDKIDIGFYWCNNSWSDWLHFDDDEHNETRCYVTLTIQDLAGDKGPETVIEALHRCWNMMFPAGT